MPSSRELVVELPPSVLAAVEEVAESKVQLRTAVRRAQLVRLALRGLTASQAAEVTGINVHTVRHIYADPSFRRAVMGKVETAFNDMDAGYFEKKKTLHERLVEKSERAFDELVGLLESDQTHPNLKAKIALEFLDRNPETLSGQVVMHAHERFDPEQLAHAASVAKEVDSVRAGKLTPIRRAG